MLVILEGTPKKEATGTDQDENVEGKGKNVTSGKVIWHEPAVMPDVFRCNR